MTGVDPWTHHVSDVQMRNGSLFQMAADNSNTGGTAGISPTDGSPANATVSY